MRYNFQRRRRRLRRRCCHRCCFQRDNKLIETCFSIFLSYYMSFFSFSFLTAFLPCLRVTISNDDAGVFQQQLFIGCIDLNAVGWTWVTFQNSLSLMGAVTKKVLLPISVHSMRLLSLQLFSSLFCIGILQIYLLIHVTPPSTPFFCSASLIPSHPPIPPFCTFICPVSNYLPVAHSLTSFSHLSSLSLSLAVSQIIVHS